MKQVVTCVDPVEWGRIGFDGGKELRINKSVAATLRLNKC